MNCSCVEKGLISPSLLKIGRVLGSTRFCAVLLVGLLAVISPALTVYAESVPTAKTMDAAYAVNISGRQRMLSQRMVKAYLMLAQDIASEDALRILQVSISQFESQLVAQKSFQPTPMVQSTLVKLDSAWMRCKALLEAAPSRAGAEELYAVNEALQQAAHDVTLAYEGVSAAPLVHLVNLSGRQRMLSQRMAKFYFYRAWGLFGDPADMELHLSQAHFTAVLNQIAASPHATMQIKESLEELRRAWIPYQQALFASNVPAQMRVHAPRVAELSERVLASAEELVALVVAQAQAESN